MTIIYSTLRFKEGVMTPRQKHLQEIKELKEAKDKTKSPYAKRDFEKALKRKKRELMEYDKWRKN